MSAARIPRSELRVAVAFFGITRSLRLTVSSIQERIIAPARAIASDVQLFGHFYDQGQINNPRSNELGALDRDEYKLLELDVLEREAPNACLALHDYEGLKTFGDPWKDDFVSLRNLVHQLHSLKRVTEMTMAWQPHMVIFTRPDLYYHHSATQHLEAQIGIDRECILLPDWAQWHGFNDRFAIAKGDGAIRAYGMRIDRLGEYCRLGKKPHAEQFLKFALKDVCVLSIPFHASRVRSNGMVVDEDFTPGRGKGGKRMLTFDSFVQALEQSTLTQRAQEMP